MLGSYYPPYFSTPGQVRVAPGVGAYYSQQRPMAGVGAYYSADGLGLVPSPGVGALVFGIALNAAAGYVVGKQLGYPTAGAIATGLFGLPGLFGTAVYASYNKRGGR